MLYPGDIEKIHGRFERRFADHGVPFTTDDLREAVDLVNELQSQQDLIGTGWLMFDHNGPLPTECEYCGHVYQYVPDHECFGIRSASQESASTSDYYYRRA